jgi:hypothetical protein
MRREPKLSTPRLEVPSVKELARRFKLSVVPVSPEESCVTWQE